MSIPENNPFSTIVLYNYMNEVLKHAKFDFFDALNEFKHHINKKCLEKNINQLSKTQYEKELKSILKETGNSENNGLRLKINAIAIKNKKKSIEALVEIEFYSNGIEPYSAGYLSVKTEACLKNGYLASIKVNELVIANTHGVMFTIKPYGEVMVQNNSMKVVFEKETVTLTTSNKDIEHFINAAKKEKDFQLKEFFLFGNDYNNKIETIKQASPVSQLIIEEFIFRGKDAKKVF